MEQKDIFEKTYTELANSIFRYIYFRVFDRDVAKDLTQETFYRLWDYLAKNKKIENVKAFTYRIAHNLIVNFIRDKKITFSIEQLEEAIGFDPADTDQQESQNKARDLASVLDSFKILNDQDSELMKLRYVDGLTIQEISRIIDSSENNISVRIFRLLEKLKKYHSQT